MSSAVKGAAGDAILTFLWVLCASSLGVSTHAIVSFLELSSFPFASHAVTVTLITVLVIAATLFGAALGGAAFNPTSHAAFYAAGLGDNSLFSMSLRFPAQVWLKERVWGGNFSRDFNSLPPPVFLCILKSLACFWSGDEYLFI